MCTGSMLKGFRYQYGEISRKPCLHTELSTFELPAGAVVRSSVSAAAPQDPDLTTGLHHNTFWYYDPQVGRFLTQDPIGLWGAIISIAMFLALRLGSIH